MERLALTAALLLVVPAAGGAQQCGPQGGWIAAAGSLSRYATAGGIDAKELGADAGLRTGPVVLQASYRRVIPDGGGAEPNVARLRVAIPVGSDPSWDYCLVVHGGGSHFSADGDEATVVAGGLGLRVERPLASGTLLPYGEIRGLRAAVSGEVIGEEIEADGGSFGGEVGVEVRAGPLLLDAAASLDKLDGALGIPPYPERQVRVSLGFRF